MSALLRRASSWPAIIRDATSCAFAQHDFPRAHVAMESFCLHFLRKQLMERKVYDQVLLTARRRLAAMSLAPPSMVSAAMFPEGD
ncbi:MAG: hypothetical protein WBO09_21685 [Methylocystis silviterrae]|uniref:hypothetical protein n=1 Tax=Methylocystis silviterrae TaxID=2743612 RepID=UPI003C71B0C8